MFGLSSKEVRRYAGLLALTIALAIVASTSTVMFLGHLSAAVSGGDGGLQRLLSSGGLLLLAMGASYLSQVCLGHVSYGFAHDMRMSVARCVVDAPLERIDVFGLNRIITLLIQDIRNIIDLVVFLPRFVPAVAIVIGCTAYLFYLDPLIGGAVVIGAALLLVVGARATLDATRVLILSRNDDEALRLKISQLVVGAKEVKLNAQRRRNLVDRDIAMLSRRAADNYIRCMHMYRSYDEIVKVGYFGFFLVALSYGAITPSFGVAGTGAVIILLFFMQSPIQMVNFGWERMTPAWISYTKLRDLHSYLTELQEQPTRADAAAFADWREIRIDGARFVYPNAGKGGAPFALGPIDVTLKRGQLVFITGANGAGKTTLSKLLCGLYRPTEGRVLVDGVPIAESNLYSYREMFSVLFADKFLFEELCPAPGVNHADVEHLLSELRISEKVSLNDWRFSTLDLSTGQRDRLALVDSISQRRPIAIFDEWAANQDPAARARFYDELLPRFRREGQTIIVISHDDRYYDRADMLWRMEGGRLVSASTAMAAST